MNNIINDKKDHIRIGIFLSIMLIPMYGMISWRYITEDLYRYFYLFSAVYIIHAMTLIITQFIKESDLKSRGSIKVLNRYRFYEISIGVYMAANIFSAYQLFVGAQGTVLYIALGMPLFISVLIILLSEARIIQGNQVFLMGTKVVPISSIISYQIVESFFGFKKMFIKLHNNKVLVINHRKNIVEDIVKVVKWNINLQV